jgi:hypothetical protein
LKVADNTNLPSVLEVVLERVDPRSKDADPQRRYHITRLHLPGDTSSRWIITVPAFGDAPERTLFVKHYSPTSKFHQDVAHEFRGLLAAHLAFTSSRYFRAPAPYWFDDDQRIIVMEHCPSVPLGRWLFHRLRWSAVPRFFSLRQTARDGFAQAGRLLAEFQAIPPLPALPGQPNLDPPSILRRYDGPFLRHLEACNVAGIPRALLNRVRQYVRERLWLPRRIEIVAQHSDFGPWNILKGGPYLYLVDFHNHTVGLRTHDAAYFHAALDLWSRFRSVAESEVKEAQDVFLSAFLQGSAEAGRPAPEWRNHDIEALPLFRELRIMHMTYFAQIVLSRRRSLRELPYAPRSRARYFQQWFEREIAEQECT